MNQTGLPIRITASFGRLPCSASTTFPGTGSPAGRSGPAGIRERRRWGATSMAPGRRRWRLARRSPRRLRPRASPPAPDRGQAPRRDPESPVCAHQSGRLLDTHSPASERPEVTPVPDPVRAPSLQDDDQAPWRPGCGPDCGPLCRRSSRTRVVRIPPSATARWRSDCRHRALRSGSGSREPAASGATIDR